MNTNRFEKNLEKVYVYLMGTLEDDHEVLQAYEGVFYEILDHWLQLMRKEPRPDCNSWPSPCYKCRADKEERKR